MSTVLISGYYGFDNLGDEAVLGGLLAGLRADAPSVTPLVLSANPARTEALHQVEAVPRMQPQALRAAFARADMLLSGGGSLLQDVTSLQSALYYLGVLWWAQRLGLPTMVIGQGLGPLTRMVTRAVARQVLNRVNAITVRDAASATFLAELGVTVPPVEVTADLAYLLEPEPTERVGSWWTAHMPSNRPVIAVALRAWQDGKAPARYTAIADGLAALAAHSGALLLFIPLHHDRDLPFAVEMAGWTPAESRVLELALTPGEMLDFLHRTDLVVAMRLHALILAARCGVPALGIAYDPKVTDCAREACLPTPIPWAALTTDALTAALTDAWDTRAAMRETLRDTGTRLRALAHHNIDVFLHVLAAAR